MRKSLIMSVKIRLKEFIKTTGLTVQAWEKTINVSNGYVNGMVKGIGEDKIQKILELYPNLNFDWLMTGRGNMYFEEFMNKDFSESLTIANDDFNNDYWRGRYDQLREDYDRLFEELRHIKSASAS